MSKMKTFNPLVKIFDNLEELQALYNIKVTTMCKYYDENKDYSDIFALDNIITEKLKNVIKDFEKFLQENKL